MATDFLQIALNKVRSVADKLGTNFSAALEKAKQKPPTLAQQYTSGLFNTVSNNVKPIAQGLASLDPQSRANRQAADNQNLIARQNYLDLFKKTGNKKYIDIANSLGGDTAQQNYAGTLPSTKDVLISGAKTLGTALSGGVGPQGLLGTAGVSGVVGQFSKNDGESGPTAAGRTFGDRLPFSRIASGIS